MWDLNHAERRALSASVLLVGLAGASRLTIAPSPGEFTWRPAGVSRSMEAPRDEVSVALAREARAQTPLGPGERVDISSAPAEELRRLSGVGPSLAEAIIRERTSRPFLSVADLDRVPGIGPATFERLKDRVEVRDPPVGGAPRTPSVGTDPGPPAPGGPCGDLTDLNAASSADLQRLPGVGPALAKRILASRARKGGFDRPEDLEQVRGIGSATLARLADLICVR